MLIVPRGSFVPPEYQAEAWVDSPIRVSKGGNSITLAPQLHKLCQVLQPLVVLQLSRISKLAISHCSCSRTKLQCTCGTFALLYLCVPVCRLRSTTSTFQRLTCKELSTVCWVLLIP
jgi:hypothetical protein